MKVNEKPILFNSEMVRAVLEGRKTQTRRVMRDQPAEDAVMTISDQGNWWDVLDGDIDMPLALGPYKCPYGAVGDQLWVRETWAIQTGCQYDHSSRVHYRSDDGKKLVHWMDGHKIGEKYGLSLTGQEKWRPSIFMPRWASRIQLEVVSVKVERVQEISEDDAIAEGISTGTLGTYDPQEECPEPSYFFKALWDSINKKRGFGWNVNPWVFVIEFKRLLP